MREFVKRVFRNVFCREIRVLVRVLQDANHLYRRWFRVQLPSASLQDGIYIFGAVIMRPEEYEEHCRLKKMVEECQKKDMSRLFVLRLVGWVCSILALILILLLVGLIPFLDWMNPPSQIHRYGRDYKLVDK
jgi:uncharacterized membrane protein YbhN (UPF0104 family)